jgi:Flp pilus assembly protein TadD
LQNDFDAASNILSKAYSLSHSINIGIRYAKSLYMQGALPQFNEVLQQLKQNHPNDPQLNQLDSLILPQHIKKS